MSRPACASAPPYFNDAAASRWLARSLFVTVDPGTTGVRLNATVLRVCCWAGLRNRSASRWRVPGLASSRWILLLCAVVPWPGWSLLSSATDRFFGMRALAMLLLELLVELVARGLLGPALRGVRGQLAPVIEVVTLDPRVPEPGVQELALSLTDRRHQPGRLPLL